MKRQVSRLAQASKIALALPGTTRRMAGDHAAFIIGKKTFGYFLNDHHGDGIVGITVKVMAGENAALVATQPARFYLPAYLAAKGWVALRLDRGKVDWHEVRELLLGSYRMIAPKRLADSVKL
jgi:hypothetical protein